MYRPRFVSPEGLGKRVVEDFQVSDFAVLVRRHSDEVCLLKQEARALFYFRRHLIAFL